MNKNEHAPHQPRFSSHPPLAMLISGRKGRKSICWVVKLFILLQKIGNIWASICTFQQGKDEFSAFRPPPFSTPSFFTSFFSTQELARPNATKNPFLLPKCSCESDWANAFCARIELYAQMEEEKAPSVCVCRQMIGPQECRQFLSRCFRRRRQSSSPLLPQQFPQQHRSVVKLEDEKCGCCFNQPDQFCNQLDCHKMRPKFDSPKIDCRCFLPTQTEQMRPTGEYPPEHICQGNDAFASLSQHLPRGIDQENDEFVLPFSSSSSSSSSSPHLPQKSTSSNLAHIFRSNAPYARFVSFLLLALLTSILLAVLVCFWSHWSRIRQGRRKAKVEAEQPVTSTTQLNGEDEEIIRGTTITTATNEGVRRIEGGGENGTAPLLLLQEATV